MKSEIGGLLERRGVDVLWVVGASSECPETYYLTGGANLTAAEPRSLTRTRPDGARGGSRQRPAYN